MDANTTSLSNTHSGTFGHHRSPDPALPTLNSKPIPQVFKPLKKRHTTTFSSTLGTKLEKPARAAVPRRQSTFLQYSTDSRQRHDASVDLIPAGLTPALPPTRRSASRRSAGSTAETPTGVVVGMLQQQQQQQQQHKLTEFGVMQMKEQRPSRQSAPAAIPHSTVVTGTRKEEAEGRQALIGQDFPATDSGDDCEQNDLVREDADHQVKDGCGGIVEQGSLQTPAATSETRPQAALPKRTTSLYLADLPAAPQYFEVLPRLPRYPPTSPPPVPAIGPPTKHTPSDPVPAAFDQQQASPAPFTGATTVVSPAQQQINGARAERRPVTLAMIADVWREQLALQLGTGIQDGGHGQQTRVQIELKRVEEEMDSQGTFWRLG